MTFEELVAPWPADHFWSNVWERRAAHLSSRAAGHYDRLATVGEIEDLVFRSGALPDDAVRLFRGAEDAPATRWAEPDWEAGQSAGLTRLHEQGYGILIGSAERFLPRLAAHLAALEGCFKARCMAHLVISPPERAGLAPHSDAYGIFVLQIDGVKSWSLYEEAPHEARLSGRDEHQLIGTAPARRFRLEAGDLLYLPRGTIHSARTTDARSIHLSLAIVPPCGSDLLSLLSVDAGEDPFFAEYIPYGIGETPEKRADYAAAFRARLAGLAAETDLFALLDRRRAERAAMAAASSPTASGPGAVPREGSRAAPSARDAKAAPDRPPPPPSASRDGEG